MKLPAIAAVFIAFVTLHSPWTQAATPLTHVAIYRGPAGCEDCSENVKQALLRLSPDYQIDFVGADEAVDITPQTLARYDLYVQPGGGQDIPAALDSLGAARVQAIREYVARGGRYLGLCMGAYLADKGNFGLIRYDLDSEAGRPGFEVKGIEDAAVRVVWDGKADSVFYQDGPYFPKADARTVYGDCHLCQWRCRGGAVHLCERCGGAERPASGGGAGVVRGRRHCAEQDAQRRALWRIGAQGG